MVAACALTLSAGPVAAVDDMPWRAEGLSERQAAVHLLNRFTYGPRPGDVDELIEMGLDNWLEWQLQGDAPGPVANAALRRVTAATLSAREIVERYPHHSMVVAEAIGAGKFSKDDYTGRNGPDRQQLAQAALKKYAKGRGYQSRAKILAQLRTQKLLRALYSESQLSEVMTAFWFNHFYVSAADASSRTQLLSYERDAIRPFALGDFRQLLRATARHPAMLLYLDNTHSQADPGVQTTFAIRMTEFGSFSPKENAALRSVLAKTLRWHPAGVMDMDGEGALEGLNENYARELLELHTLGVDGGYTQNDVIEAARAFTGWTHLPENVGKRLWRHLTEAAEDTDLGFVIDGEFVFRADQHDAEAKSFLGSPLPAGRGVEDGEDVLDILVRHPATARHVMRKLAIRFVSDEPSKRLVAQLERVFEITAGDLREVIRELVTTREFWQEAHRPSKMKSPFELAVSALRSLDAEVENTHQLSGWLVRSGQTLYGYVAPTGYPDRPPTWSSAGSILARINFVHALARGKVEGVDYDPLELIGTTEVLSVSEAVRTVLPLVLPERSLGELLAEIEAGETEVGKPQEAPTEGLTPQEQQQRLRRAERTARYAFAFLLGSPEFQRR